MSDRSISLSQRLAETCRLFGPLGLTSFGGPAAHVAMFHSLFVEKLKWMDDAMFSEVFAIGQALPGPGSTQMAFIIATHRNGLFAGILAFFLWSIPGFSVMSALAVLGVFLPPQLPNWAVYLRYGLSSVAVGLIGAAGYKLSLANLKANFDILICIVSSCVGIIGYRSSWVPPAVILLGGLILFVKERAMIAYKLRYQQVRTGSEESFESQPSNIAFANDLSIVSLQPELPSDIQTPLSAVENDTHLPLSVKASATSLSIFLALLIASFVIIQSNVETNAMNAMKVISSFYIIGSIIFGGGPVVIPLLYNYVVLPGWLSAENFLFGLAIINILPGPNFNFAAFCAGLSLHHLLSPGNQSRYGILICLFGSMLGYVGIFFPGLTVKIGIIPLWTYLRKSRNFKYVLHGVSCAAIGLVYSSVVSLWMDSFSNLHEPLNLWFICLGMVSFVFTAYFKLHALILMIFGVVVSLLLCLNGRS